MVGTSLGALADQTEKTPLHSMDSSVCILGDLRYIPLFECRFIRKGGLLNKEGCVGLIGKSQELFKERKGSNEPGSGLFHILI